MTHAEMTVKKMPSRTRSERRRGLAPYDAAL
jgi:hypothetical protein